MSLFKPSRRLVILEEKYPGRADTLLSDKVIRDRMKELGITVVEKWVTDERVEQIEEDHMYDSWGDDA